MSYPILSEDRLEPVAKRPRFLPGQGQKVRNAIPQALPRQAVVLRTGNKLVRADETGHANRDALDNATSYCVVDLAPLQPISVELRLPSGGVHDFTLRVTFLCTVTDAVRVVEAAPGDMRRALSDYLNGCAGLTRAGMPYGVHEAGNAEDAVRSQLDAYIIAKPLVLPGIRSELGPVEVLSPDDIREEERRAEKERREREAAREREEEQVKSQLHIEELQRKLEEARIENQRLLEPKQRELEELRREGEQRKEQTERRFGWLMKREAAEEQRQVDHEQRAFELRETQMVHDALDDPRKVEALAYVQGQLSAAEQLARADQDTQYKREREHEQQQRSWAAEEADRELQIEEQRAAREREREERHRQRELDDRAAAAQIEVLRILAEHGQADQVPMSDVVQRMIDNISAKGQPIQGELPAAAATAVPEEPHGRHQRDPEFTYPGTEEEEYGGD